LPIPGEAARYSGMMPPTHSEMISPTVYHGLRRLGKRGGLDHRSATCQLPRIFGKYGGAGEAKDKCQYDCAEHRQSSNNFDTRRSANRHD
jgi:hypothetical protein